MKNIFTKTIITAMFFSQIISAVFASQPNYYENARSLGMGGVSVVVSDDYLSLYRNPAGLSLQKESYAVLTPSFSRNTDYSNVIDHIDALSDSDTAASRISNYRHLDGIIGKTGYQRWSDTVYYIGQNGYGISIRYDDSQFYTVENPTSPRVKSSVYKDCVFTGSISRPFEDNGQVIFNDKAAGWWGATLKIATRKMTETCYSARDFAALTPNALKDTDSSGITFDADIGGLWQIASPMTPTFGVFVGNLLGSKFSDEAGRLNRYYSVGASIKPLTGDQKRNDKLVLACEFFDDGAHYNSLNKLRLGARIQVGKRGHFLTGVKGGYLTGGFDYSWNDLTFRAATYGEELGKRPGDRVDRTYAVDACLRF